MFNFHLKIMRKVDKTKKELPEIEKEISRSVKLFSSYMKSCFNKINDSYSNLEAANSKDKEKEKKEIDSMMDDLSKKFTSIQELEINRREKLIEKLKKDQNISLKKFNDTLNNLKEFLTNINKVEDKPIIKSLIENEQKIVLESNNYIHNEVINYDNSNFQNSANIYENNQIAKEFLQSLTNNYKYLESLPDFKAPIDFIDGILMISKRVQENKADLLHKWSMKLFKEGNFLEAIRKMELAVKTTQDPKGKELLQFELDKIKLTNMHAKAKWRGGINFDEALEICNRLLESKFLKGKNRQKILAIKELDLKKKKEIDEAKKNKKESEQETKDNEKDKKEEIEEINIELGEKE